MSAPLISLLHPTRRVSPSEAFPRGWRDAHDAWLSRADHPERIEYVLSVHESRWAEFDAQPNRARRPGIGRTHGWHEWTVVQNSGPDTCVANLNNAARHSRGALLMGVADDLYPPEHWDTLVLEAMAQGLQHDGVLHSDELQRECVCVFSSGASPERDRELMIAGAVTRNRYERYGFILDPDFESMFSDNWYGYCARRDAAEGKCQIVERLDIKFEHRHPIFGAGRMDEAYEQQNRIEAYKRGELTFIQKTTGKKILLLCFPGEVFRREWVENTLNMLFSLAGDVLPVPFWNYSSNVYATRMEMAKAAIEFRPRAEFILWKDDDNEATAQQVTMLAQDLKDHPELDVVVGWCWCDNHAEKAHEANEWMMSCGRQRWSDLQCNRFRGDDILKALKGNGLITSDDIEPHVFWSGFPLVLMRVSALEKLGPEAFRARTTDPAMLAALEEARINLDPTIEFYESIAGRIDAVIERAKVIANTMFGQTSEDTSFFMACHEKGIKCAVDVRVQVAHVKPRAIAPQYIPESERVQARAAVGDMSLLAPDGRPVCGHVDGCSDGRPMAGPKDVDGEAERLAFASGGCAGE